jgi:hypothetical protein
MLCLWGIEPGLAWNVAQTGYFLREAPGDKPMRQRDHDQILIGVEADAKLRTTEHNGVRACTAGAGLQPAAKNARMRAERRV